MSETSLVITIDGPSGSGKGTISQMLAEHLGFKLLDSGALYRVLALAAKQHAVEFSNEPGLEVLARHLDVQFDASNNAKVARIILEGEDVTDQIRTEEIGSMASQVAAFPSVRVALLERQRSFAEGAGLVADGRDMGTVVFPEADVKFFLIASRSERARRRYKQLLEKGINVTLAQIEEEIGARDTRDRERAASPLRPAVDAIVVDTSDCSIEQVHKRIVHEVEKVLADDLIET